MFVLVNVTFPGMSGCSSITNACGWILQDRLRQGPN
jgi:hypothetical protein